MFDNSTNNSNSSNQNGTLNQSQNSLLKVKNNIESLTDTLLKSTNTKFGRRLFRILNGENSGNETETNGPDLMKTELFSVSFFQEAEKNGKSSNSFALNNNMSFGNFSECEEILKSLYNITTDLPLIKKQVEFDSTTNLEKINDENSSKLIKFEFYNPINLEKLNKSFCDSYPTAINIPFKNSVRLKMNTYTQALIIRDVVDIYNSKSPGYQTRCLTTKEFSTGADTSINYRRTKLFQNETISCSEGCVYQGLDENKYVKCDCSSMEKSEMSNTGTADNLFALPQMNYDIALCYKEVFFNVIIMKFF